MLQYNDIDSNECTEHKISPRTAQNQQRSRSPGPDKSPRQYSVHNPDLKENLQNPKITVTGETDPQNRRNSQQTWDSSRGMGKRNGPLNSSKTDLISTDMNQRRKSSGSSGRPSLERSKSPSPRMQKASSISSIPNQFEPRRSSTPTPTSTSQRRATLSVRSKSPDPSLYSEKRRQTLSVSPRKSGPPSSYR